MVNSCVCGVLLSLSIVHVLLCSAIWDLVPYLEEAELRRKEKIVKLSLQEQKDLGVAEFYPSAAKKRKMDVELTEDGVMELCVRYNRREFDTMRTPKTVLLDFTRRKHMKHPTFLTVSVTVQYYLSCFPNNIVFVSCHAHGRLREGRTECLSQWSLLEMRDTLQAFGVWGTVQ